MEFLFLYGWDWLALTIFLLLRFLTHYRHDNCKSQSEFIEKAISFYIGYLDEERSVNYISPLITETVKATIAGTEQRLSRLMFKVAVELGKISNMLAAVNDIDDETLRQLQSMCVNEVRRINGIISYIDDYGIGAFVMLKKEECEEIPLDNQILPKCSRLKISTLKLSDRVEGNRLGEGAIGIALWNWLESDDEEIYVTVFDKHRKLIEMLQKFGFELAGYNSRNEGVYLRSKNAINFMTPYTSFPFINKEARAFAMLPIEAEWHDKIFPYSELKNTKQDTEEFAAANGMTKTYICFPVNTPCYSPGMPIMIYRKSSDEYNRGFKSVVTSYGTIVRSEPIKQNWSYLKSFEEYVKIVGNKSVFTHSEIKNFYEKMKNLYVLELVYNHAFGKGCNVNYNTLNDNGIWKNCHPYQAVYSMNDFRAILSLAKQDENKLIK